MAQAATALNGPTGLGAPEQTDLVDLITGTLHDQVGANRQDRLVMAGAANLVRTEEDFTGSIYPVLEAIEEQVVLLRLFGEMATDQHGVSVSIGRENAPFGLGETSVLTSGYTSRGDAARLGVLGPTRMDYSNNMAAVRAVARYLSRLLGEN
jgi:heat-inducible transcriptional repressor